MAELSVSTWNFTSDDAEIHHLGPMAQDFYAAFGLGKDDRHIAPLDTGGVALAAIKGLDEVRRRQEKKIDSLERENTLLKDRLAVLEDQGNSQLEDRLAVLEQAVKALAASSASIHL